MKAKKYSEEQIVGALHEADAGAKLDDACRRVGVSKVTCYRWQGVVLGHACERREAAAPARA